jgi:hypothetical protein
MKVVQVGILVVLIAVGALLFMIYRERQQPQTAAVPATQESPPVAAPAPAEPRPAAQTPAAELAAPKPSRTPRTRAASKTVSEPVPVAPEPPAAEPAPPPQPTSTVASNPPAPAPAPETRAEPAPPPPPPQPRSVTIDAGTLLSTRLAETLSTEKVQTGETFTGTLDRPLVVDGLVIAERGARVEGRVVEAEQAGRVRGVASLSLQLVRLVTSDGQRIDIQTDVFHKEGETSKKEDAAKVGGGAALGAIIGAIAGGGKGAAIGAGVGGAAGAGTVAATRGKPAVLPVETRIDFRISRPITVTEKK